MIGCMQVRRLVAFFLLLSIAAASHADMGNTKVLIVAGDENFPPYEFVDVVDGEKSYRGFNVDLLKAVALDTGYEIRFQPMPWIQAIKALERGEVDAISGMKYDGERAKKFDFSEPYMINSLAIFVQNGTQTINSIADLTAKKVAVQENDVSYDQLKDKPVHLILASNQEMAMELLIKGQVDAVLGNRLTGEYILQRLNRQEEIKTVGGPINMERYCVAVQKGNSVLGTLNHGLNEIRRSGTYDKLYAKWFGEAVNHPLQYYKTNFKRALGALVVLFIAAAIIAQFNFLLKREVKKRVREIEDYNALLKEKNDYIERVRRYQNSMLNSGYSGIVTVDPSGKIEFANDYAKTYLRSNAVSLTGEHYQQTPIAQIVDNCSLPVSRPAKGETVMGTSRIDYTVDDLLLDGRKDTIIHFRDITEEQKLRGELTRRDKMEAIGNLVTSIAHEIRNPLTSIKTFVELLPDKYDNPLFREQISRLVPKEVERLNLIITDLLAYANPRSSTPENVCLKALLDNTMVFFSHAISKAGIDLKIALSEEIVVRVDAHQLRQVLINVILNAIQALDQVADPVLTINSGLADGRAFLDIGDNGVGISGEGREHIFEPFFSTKDGGTGLGLFISYELAKKNHAVLSLNSGESMGTIFRLLFAEEITVRA